MDGIGTWGALAFDNDEDNDWAYGLDGADYVEAPVASEALAACEVLARLKAHAGYKNADTQKVDEWVAAHPIEPPPGIIAHADRAIDRILGEKSELRELWEESGRADEWRDAISDLRNRVLG